MSVNTTTKERKLFHINIYYFSTKKLGFYYECGGWILDE